MQSKPNAPFCFYLAFNGHTTIGLPMTDIEYLINPGWVGWANTIDTDGTYIGLKGLFNDGSEYIDSVKFPPSKAFSSSAAQSTIFNIVRRKYEIFDVNITTSENVFNSYSTYNKFVCVFTELPTDIEFNSLRDSTSENTEWPYSYRRALLALPINPLNISIFPLRRATQVILANYGLWGVAPRPRILGGLIPTYLTTPAVVFGSTLNLSNGNSMNANPDGSLIQNGSFEAQTPEYAGFTAAHELGHLLGLYHADTQGLPGQPYDGNGHPDWSPLMGTVKPQSKVSTRLIQWSKGEYSFANNRQKSIELINGTLNLIKKPRQDMSFNLANFESECWPIQEGYNVRVLTKSDVKSVGGVGYVIEGMIGFPYDFDILKILLPKGTYKFEIDNTSVKKLGSMLDIDMNIINCHSQQSKEEINTTCNQDNLPTIYPDYADTQCIAYNSCLDFSYQRILFRDLEDGFTAKTIEVTLDYTSIVYLKIQGDSELDPDIGWTKYGSLGTYELKITKDGSINNPGIFLPDDVLPVCNCQEFEACGANGVKKVILYVQDDGEDPGTQNQAGAHIKEYTTILNGELSTTKKFLVYGPPLQNIDDKCPDGKFCLTVFDPQRNQCVKQEFVVGNEWEKDTTIQ